MYKSYIPYGSDVSAGKFQCLDCGYILTIQSTKSLPPCPNFDKNTHTENAWTNLSGQGDAPDDPYPNEK
ncbi:hypothetical protein [Brachyspira aalborgi]|jgi:hypothetical protein|uniref:Zinc ribbon domain-containing protein n=1 Tax=Brachyspira aalborgi TaxID=29522 RepID=A0ABY3KBX2_9SPIR|nr:hypothetical protein [Brachyspira aalborgi]MBS4762737.1 hypothetical protein [Brachyspira sp.]TXJ34379.1 hypothetical protein EPJ71_00495 [Brachyspira aalborgi]